MPFIPSFCDISLGESMFRDARSYFNSLTRNAEAFSQIASRLKDSIFLTDEELYSVICSHISKEYSVKTPAQLNAQQKIDTARQMHFDYNASNQQLRRMLRLDLSILEELFPSLAVQEKARKDEENGVVSIEPHDLVDRTDGLAVISMKRGISVDTRAKLWHLSIKGRFWWTDEL